MEENLLLFFLSFPFCKALNVEVYSLQVYNNLFQQYPFRNCFI